MSLIRKHVAVLQAWACLDLVSRMLRLNRTQAHWRTVVQCAAFWCFCPFCLK